MFSIVPSRLTTGDNLVPLHRLFQRGTLNSLYAMPMSSTRVFFEVGTEISLRSYIPVGGSLPNKHQKNLAFGAAASVVHPATGTNESSTFYTPVSSLHILTTFHKIHRVLRGQIFV